MGHYLFYRLNFPKAPLSSILQVLFSWFYQTIDDQDTEYIAVLMCTVQRTNMTIHMFIYADSARQSIVNSLPESPSLGLVTGKSGSLSSIFFCWTCVVGCSNTSCVLNNCSGLAGICTGGGTKGANFNRFLGNLAFLLIGLFVAVSLFTLPVLQIMKQKIFLITLTK